MELETNYGVPAVGVHADAFARLVAAVTQANGMPGSRRAFVPTPVTTKTPDELRGYIEGNDPVNGRPFMEQVMEELTRLLGEDELRGVAPDRSTPRLLEPASEDELHELFWRNNWTDQFPIVLPTEERVAAMLAATSHAPDEIVGELRMTTYRELWAFDVEKVAVNAVMAGARPEYLPVILALAASGITARQSSTSSMANIAVVNGPIREEIGMNSGIGALGPYNHANATIGRAYGLLSQNLQGGSVPGVSYMGAMGNPLNYGSPTFAENQEKSPWEPYHVQQGFDPEESTVTPFYVWGLSWNEGVRATWETNIKAMLGGQDPWMGCVLAVDPIVARDLAARGFHTKEKLTSWIHDNVRMRADIYWERFTMRNLMHDLVEAGEEPWATYFRCEPDDLLPVFEPELLHVVVVGGSTNGQWYSFNGRTYDPRFRNSPDDPSTFSVDAWR